MAASSIWQAVAIVFSFAISGFIIFRIIQGVAAFVQALTADDSQQDSKNSDSPER